jgi:penicillin-binding protein 2
VFGDFPVAVSAKTGSGQVSGKQDTSWFASYAPSADPQYAVVMMISQGGTGAGTSAPGVKKIYEALFGVANGVVDPSTSVLPGGQLPTTLPTVRADGTLAQPAPSQPAPAPAAPAPASFTASAATATASYRVGERR